MKVTTEYTLEELNRENPVVCSSVEKFMTVLLSSNIIELTIKQDGTLILTTIQ